MQAGLIAASSAADSAVWYHTLQCDFPFLFGLKQEIPAIPIMIDNKAALSVANHPESSPRTRHICLRELRTRRSGVLKNSGFALGANSEPSERKCQYYNLENKNALSGSSLRTSDPGGVER